MLDHWGVWFLPGRHWMTWEITPRWQRWLLRRPYFRRPDKMGGWEYLKWEDGNKGGEDAR